MSSIAKEIEEAAALRQRIEEEREKGEEYGEALNCVANVIKRVIGKYNTFPLSWINYMDNIKISTKLKPNLIFRIQFTVTIFVRFVFYQFRNDFLLIHPFFTVCPTSINSSHTR